MAGQGHDISIDEAKAKQWVEDVKSEVAQTELLLRKVAAANRDFPEDNDTILGFIKKAGNTMETLWKGLADACRRVNDIISEAINNVAKGGSEIVGNVEDFTHKLG